MDTAGVDPVALECALNTKSNGATPSTANLAEGSSQSGSLSNQALPPPEHVSSIPLAPTSNPTQTPLGQAKMTLAETSPSVEITANLPLHGDDFVKENNPLQMPKKQIPLLPAQTFTPSGDLQILAAATSEDVVSLSRDPVKEQSPVQTGASVNTTLHAASNLKLQEILDFDSLSELHPSDPVSIASDSSDSTAKAKASEALFGRSRLGNNQMLGNVKPSGKVPVGGVMVEVNSVDEQLSLMPSAALTNDSTSGSTFALPVTSNNVIDQSENESKFDGKDATEHGHDLAKNDNAASHLSGLEGQRTRSDSVVQSQISLASFSSIVAEQGAIRPLSSTTSGEETLTKDGDITSDGAEPMSKFQVCDLFLPNIQGNLRKDTDLSTAVSPCASNKLDSTEIADANPSSGHERSDSITQNLVSKDNTASSHGPSSATLSNLSTAHNPPTLGNGSINEEAEFEMDSSPLEGTSSDTSSLSSSLEDSDSDYKALDPEEQARILMLGDGGSDDEGGEKTAKGMLKGSAKTQNEKPAQVVEKPALVVTNEMEIEELGTVQNLVDNIVLIKAKVSGEYRVLESGSVLCLENRSVIGTVAETLGRVQQPLYSVLFTNSAGIAEAGIEKTSKVFYVLSHSTFVFTQAIKSIKGSDASNIHDEEVGDDEMEFSDDEAEAAYKRSQKLQREERRGGHNPSKSMGISKPARGRGNRHDRGRHDHGRMAGSKSIPEEVRLSYDDYFGTDQSRAREYDGPYIPLVRPTNMYQGSDREALREDERSPSYPLKSKGPGPNRGQCWRGRSSGDNAAPGRGRGRGYQRGSNHSGSDGGGYAHRPSNWQHSSTGQIQSPGTSRPGQYSPSGSYHNFSHSPNAFFPPQPPSTFQFNNQQFYQHLQNQLRQSDFPQVPPFFSPSTPSYSPVNQQFPGNLPQHPYMSPQGSFVNPAFFAHQHQSSYPIAMQITGNSSTTEAAGANPAFQAAQQRLDVLRHLSQGSNPP